MFQWAFVPASNIKLPHGESFSSIEFGTLKSFRSSDRVTRYFCGHCGAMVFWTGEDRPELIDVAVGLLDAESGARAEDWLKWITMRVSFVEHALHKEFVESFELGLQNWGKRESVD